MSGNIRADFVGQVQTLGELVRQAKNHKFWANWTNNSWSEQERGFSFGFRRLFFWLPWVYSNELICLNRSIENILAARKTAPQIKFEIQEADLQDPVVKKVAGVALYQLGLKNVEQGGRSPQVERDQGASGQIQLKLELDQANAELEKIKGRKAALEQEKKQLIDTMGVTDRAAQVKINELQGERARMLKATNQLSQALQLKVAEVEDLKKRLNETEGKRATLEAEVGSLNERIVSMEEGLRKEMHLTESQLNEALRRKEEELKATSSDLNRKVHELDQLTGEVARLKLNQQPLQVAELPPPPPYTEGGAQPSLNQAQVQRDEKLSQEQLLNKALEKKGFRLLGELSPNKKLIIHTTHDEARQILLEELKPLKDQLEFCMPAGLEISGDRQRLMEELGRQGFNVTQISQISDWEKEEGDMIADYKQLISTVSFTQILKELECFSEIPNADRLKAQESPCKTLEWLKKIQIYLNQVPKVHLSRSTAEGLLTKIGNYQHRYNEYKRKVTEKRDSYFQQLKIMKDMQTSNKIKVFIHSTRHDFSLEKFTFISKSGFACKRKSLCFRELLEMYKIPLTRCFAP